MDMFVRLLVLSAFATLMAIAAQLYFGSIIFASSKAEAQKIVLRDVYQKETHELSGIVMVPSDCHDLSVRTREVDADTTALIFETWADPTRECGQSAAPRAVRSVVFGPADLEFRALLDGEWIPLRVVNAESK